MNEQKLYKLDWETAEIKLAKGRFTHTLRRPDAEMIIDRDKDLPSEVPISKSGGYALPDPTETEDIDAKYYDKLKVSAEGYGEKSIPAYHKSAVFQGLYLREIYLEDDQDLFGDEITVLEEIGKDDNPDFVVKHILAFPDESELRKARRKLSSGHLEPDKRGRQKYVTSSNLKSAMDYYRNWLVRVDGATVGGETYSTENRDAFLATVDPLIQRKVVKTFVDELSGQLLD